MNTKSWIGEAPGRLDFMGGVADYSGALVLETPIRTRTRVQIAPAAETLVRVISAGRPDASLPLEWFQRSVDEKWDYATIRAELKKAQVPSWSHYVFGCLLVLNRKKNWKPSGGLLITVYSEVPEGMGVSSSAALEIATLKAVAAMDGITWTGTELAVLGQEAENQVVGAPCGLMDQLASAYGVSGQLLPILCRPDVLKPSFPLPAGTAVVGWPSGVKHDVGASPYGIARAAAFMGKKWVETKKGKKWGHASEIPIEWVISDSTFPVSMRGSEFLKEMGGVDDPLSRIDPNIEYPMQAALRFPIEETARTTGVIDLLTRKAKTDESVCREIGQLLYKSHQGYTEMGLGCDETDQMVNRIRELGPDNGFYGARISGGGSGGTVVVFLKEEAVGQLQKVSQELFFSENGPLPLIRA